MIFELQRSRKEQTTYGKHRKPCRKGEEDDCDDDV